MGADPVSVVPDPLPREQILCVCDGIHFRSSGSCTASTGSALARADPVRVVPDPAVSCDRTVQWQSRVPSRVLDY